MTLPLLLALLACGGDSLTQAGHELELEQTKSFSWVNGTTYSIELTLDGQPLEMQYWYHPLSPPPSEVPRTVYFGDGQSPETWSYDVWQSFQIYASSPEQHAAAKAFLDEGTDALFRRLARSDAYRWSYPRHQFVLFEGKPTDQVFRAPSGDSFEVTTAGSVFMNGARIGELTGTQGVPTHIAVRLEPHTFGSGPAEIQIAPAETDLGAYRHERTGEDVFATYAVEATLTP